MKDWNKTVFLVIGALLIILGLFMLIPYMVEITIGDKSHNFLFWSIFSIFIGSFAYHEPDGRKNA